MSRCPLPLAVVVLCVLRSVASAQSGTISGTVTLFEGPLEYRPQIHIYDTSGTLVPTGTALGPGGWTGPLQSPSRDTIAWSATVAPGTYYVRTWNEVQPGVSVNGWVDQLYGAGVCVAADCNPLNGTPVTVTAGQTVSGINFVLDTGASITGAGVAPLGPLGYGTYDIYDARGVQLPNRIKQSNSGSGYIATGLPAGTYYVVAHQQQSYAPETLYNSFPCDGCAVTVGTPITVALDENKTGMDFAKPSSGSISGTLRGSGTFGSSWRVNAYALNGAFLVAATVAPDGTYSIPALAPGTYYVAVDVGEVYANLECPGCNPTSGTPVTVTANATTSGIDFDLSLTQGTTVSGNDSEVSGTSYLTSPPTFGTVVFYTSSPAQPAARVPVPYVGVTRTDTGVIGFNNGSYAVTLSQGSYYAQTNPLAGHVQQIYPGIACPQGICPTGLATPITVGATEVTGIAFNPPTCTASTIAPVSLANTAVGATYRQTLLATGANDAVGWVVSSGTLPPGLSLDPNSGVLSGTPTTSGRFTFTVAAVDSIGCAGTRTYTLDVPPCAFTISDAAGFLTFRYNGGESFIQVSNACGPFTAASDSAWITVSDVIGTSEVDFFVVPNPGAARRGTLTIGPRAVTIVQGGATTAFPFGSFDTPVDSAVVSGSIPISGWALSDAGIKLVYIYRDPVQGEGSQSVFIGNATIVAGARPDVQAAFPSEPFNDRAGWGYLLLTNMLPNHGNGTFRISVYAQDFNLNITPLGTKTITAANSTATAPFGAIDTPGQGATISGSAFVNFGWALTPQPKLIPFDGSTIQVVIDGVPVGPPTAYNLFRSDVSTLFPGLKNSGGPVGYRVIDTTALSEGVHTIAWIATDDGGIATGIGSRFFTVLNSAWQPSLRANVAVTPPAVSDTELAHADTTTIPARVDGVHLGRKVDSLASLPLADGRPEGLRYDGSGAGTITISSLQGLKLSLSAGGAAHGLSPHNNKGCAPTYAGYLVVNGQLAVLPVGSSLDPAGTFYWHPGPAFFGTYQLLFVRTLCDGTQQRIPVSVSMR